MREQVSILQFGGALTALFIAFAVFLVARKNDRGDLLLAWILLLVGTVLFRTGMSVSELMVKYPHHLGVLFPLTYLIGPLLLFYARAKLTDQDFSMIHFWPHILPMIGSYLFLVPVFLLPIDKKLHYIALTSQPMLLQRVFDEFPFSSAINLLQMFFVWAILCGYTWFAWRTIPKTPGGNFKSNSHLSIHWISFLSVGLMAASLLALTSLVVIVVFNMVFLSPILMIAYLSFVAIAGYSAVHLVIRPDLLHPDDKNTITDNTVLSSDHNISVEKYENSGLSDADANAISIQLQQLMKDKALYRQHDMSLQSLAEQLGCSAKHLSQVLNNELGENFYEFVNRHRIDEIKKLLLGDALTERPIIDIALDAGFNSKPAFYNAFRKCTGMTPTEYCKLYG